MTIDRRPVPSGFFVLRSPLLPFDELVEWSRDLQAPDAVDDPAALETALMADRQRLRARLRAALDRPAVREAIFIASPDLDANVDRWLVDPDSERGRRAERALVSYYQRMASRSTPFGLFSGCAVGLLGEWTDLALGARSEYRRHTRPDMHYLTGLIAALAAEPDLRAELAFRPNSSLARLGGRWRYFRSTGDERQPTHRPVWLTPDERLERVLARAAGDATPATLVQALAADGAEPEAAAGFVDRLIDDEVLVSSLEPEVTGREPLGPLIERLEAHPAGRAAAGLLAAVRDSLGELDRARLGAPPGAYRRLAELLGTLPGRIEPARLVQAELVKPAPQARLGPEPLAEIARGVELLRRLARPPRDSLARFRAAFLARYEGRQVPLAEALDDQVGLGFGGGAAERSPLIDDLAFPRGSRDRATRWDTREALLLRLIQQAQAEGWAEIELGEADLERLAGPEPLPLPNAFAAFAVLAARSAEALVAGEFRVLLESASGPSGARLFGRFCHADRELAHLVGEHLAGEEQVEPGSIYAEVVHLADGRTGNIICRPRLREWEIPFLGRASAPPEHQLPPEDLLVSVEGERVVLRSARLGREVRPRLTSAQNYFHPRANRVYTFLCALQDQGVAGQLTWGWGPLAELPFLPRVRNGRLVLARAAWRATADELGELTGLGGAAAYRAVHAWRERRGLPRRFQLVEGDNELPVDLDNVLSLECFLQLVKGRDQARLVEQFPAPDELAAYGPDGRFAHELVIPFLVESGGPGSGRAGIVRRPRPIGVGAAAESAPARAPSRSPALQRSFPPGSEWLYAKLYTGTGTADRLLLELVAPLVREAVERGWVDRWFYLRYADPDWHLRVRFRGRPAALLGELLPALHARIAPALASGLVWKLQLDTYEREVERYGGLEGVELAERLFQADCETGLEILGLLPDDEHADARWRLTLKGLDLLLDDLGFDPRQKLEIAVEARRAYAAEFKLDLALQRQLGERFRAERRSLEALLEDRLADDDPLRPALTALQRRSERLRPIAAALHAAARDGRLATGVAQLAPSYLHVHAFRLIRADQRKHELVLYDFLTRLYESRRARVGR